jgi:hypothetical protein
VLEMAAASSAMTDNEVPFSNREWLASGNDVPFEQNLRERRLSTRRQRDDDRRFRRIEYRISSALSFVIVGWPPERSVPPPALTGDI